jgi:hypothetical protein
MNNFNQSSTGENVEFSVFYDTDNAQHYFKDFLEGADGTQVEHIHKDIYLLGDSSKPYYKKSTLNKMTKAALIELDQDYELLCPYNYNDTTKQELVSALSEVTIKRYYEYLCKMHSWYELRDHFTHDFHISRGYSQGDLVYVIAIDGFYDGQEAYLDKLFWGTPLYAQIYINDEPIIGDSYEIFGDEYSYDKDKLINLVNNKPDSTISAIGKRWLADNLPSEPKNY